ncbi:MAG: hypothetical protein ACRENG_09040 [bacterium]
MNSNILENSNPATTPYPEAESSSEQVGKVAEDVATYTYTPLKKAASVQHQIASIAVSEEVWRFAAANEIVSHLEAAVRLVGEAFRKVGKIRFSYQIDPEIENESCIIIHAEVYGVVEELVHEDLAYTKAMMRNIPADKLSLIHLFPIVI